VTNATTRWIAVRGSGENGLGETGKHSEKTTHSICVYKAFGQIVTISTVEKSCIRGSNKAGDQNVNLLKKRKETHGALESTKAWKECLLQV
jgi:small nuclear ribonucleoprotein (snRNP)-like protein